MRLPASTFLVVRHGEILSTREEARSVRRAIQELLRGGEVLLVSFSGVQVASRSFLDELLVGLQRSLREHPDCMLVAHGVNSTIRDHITSVVTNRGLLLAVVSRSGVSLIGGDTKSRRLLRAARQLEPEFTKVELLERLPHDRTGVEMDLRMLVDCGYLCQAVDRNRGTETDRLRRPPAAEQLSELAE